MSPDSQGLLDWIITYWLTFTPSFRSTPVLRRGDRPVAVVDRHRRVEEVNRRRPTELGLDHRPPLPAVEPVRIRARGPHVDAAGTMAVVAHVEVLLQQAGDFLEQRHRRLERAGHILWRGGLGHLERDNGDDHDDLLVWLDTTLDPSRSVLASAQRGLSAIHIRSDG